MMMPRARISSLSLLPAIPSLRALCRAIPVLPGATIIRLLLLMDFLRARREVPRLPRDTLPIPCTLPSPRMRSSSSSSRGEPVLVLPALLPTPPAPPRRPRSLPAAATVPSPLPMKGRRGRTPNPESAPPAPGIRSPKSRRSLAIPSPTMSSRSCPSTRSAGRGRTSAPRSGPPSRRLRSSASRPCPTTSAATRRRTTSRGSFPRKVARTRAIASVASSSRAWASIPRSRRSASAFEADVPDLPAATFTSSPPPSAAACTIRCQP
mmetsp:Transcript_14735/g.32010  ORF Transcript_14735/g.32010 Transcript_14735/m.32010 type:complete len:265 (+) Transcript_14735:588-1382(+)